MMTFGPSHQMARWRKSCCTDREILTHHRHRTLPLSDREHEQRDCGPSDPSQRTVVELENGVPPYLRPFWNALFKSRALEFGSVF